MSGGNLNFPLVVIGAHEVVLRLAQHIQKLGGISERARNSTPAQRLRFV